MNSKFMDTYNTTIRPSNTGSSYWDDTLLYTPLPEGGFAILVILKSVADYSSDIPFTGADLVPGADYPGCYTVASCGQEFLDLLIKYHYNSAWCWDDEKWITNGPDRPTNRPEV